ncbi:4-hydroxy-tetrahydrodipicolinate synthase [Bradyrhizobium jicamae]|uniref:4-hydroxy-tetrahydrodipicolinate synthase n=1 Tax=Bradyrhizobium jicamae TaxID=280332 RepID=A0A0R3LW86_9BRAD|nr:4-hydroxy-tetrahydrodipicolinate synthase [Bradyrhizobium jicamae]KRR08928.1 4-hydroxy-tetrahydrodipicolinate synthase [Bradyrhizobium jicamae]
MISLATPTSWLAGYIADLPTPFDEDDEPDLDAFAALCERQIDAGASAIVVGETAGEMSTLTAAERLRLICCAVETAQGRARIIAGAGSNSTDRAIELTMRAERAGADAVLSVVPYYNKPMQEGMVAHFRAIAASTALPVILHDIPARTVRSLADETIALLAQSRKFAGLRDATGDASRPSRLRLLVPASFRLLSGDDRTAFGFIAGGGDGCISPVSNISPDMCRTIFSNLRQDRLQSARRLQRRLDGLATCLSNDVPSALKYALSLLGLMHPKTRLPIVELDEAAKAQVARALADFAAE